MIDATLHNGADAIARSVSVDPLDKSLAVHMEDGATETVEWPKLRLVDEDEYGVRLANRARDGWRLVLPAPLDETIRAKLGKTPRYDRLTDRVGLIAATALFACGSAVGLWGIAQTPPMMAPMVSVGWQRETVAPVLADLDRFRCTNEGAQAALERLGAKLDPDPDGEPIEYRILAFPIPNAAALPGNNVVIFNGAIDISDTPEAFAGILAHEIAHVRRRHVAQAIVREYGFGSLALLVGGDTALQAQRALDISFTREHESEADAEALERLLEQGIDPSDTGEMFSYLERYEMDMSDLPRLFRSHPPTAERAAFFEDGAKGLEGEPVAAMSDADWDALLSACSTFRRYYY